MQNNYAVNINNRLGVELFDASNIHRLKLNKFTKKQIKELMIDDLVDIETKEPTMRLIKIIKEITWGIK